MKIFEATEGYEITIDGKLKGTKVYTPDDFDDSLISEITKEEANRIREAEKE